MVFRTNIGRNIMAKRANFYNPDQPLDEHGRFGDSSAGPETGGTAGVMSLGEVHALPIEDTVSALLNPATVGNYYDKGSNKLDYGKLMQGTLDKMGVGQKDRLSPNQRFHVAQRIGRVISSGKTSVPRNYNYSQHVGTSLPQPFKYMFSEPKGDVILRTGKIFAVGDYPSHGFQLTLDEALEAIQRFEAVPVDLEHQPTMLDGKLGQLVDVGLLDDNTTLVGTWEQPRWLADLLGDTELTVSSTWLEDRGQKLIGGLALTSDPAIPDAVMFSKYVAFAGQRHSAADKVDLQSIHDLAVSQGADCGNCPKCGAPMNNFNVDGGKKMGFFSKLLKGRSAEDLGLSPEELGTLAKLDGLQELQTAPDPKVAELERQLVAQQAMFSKLKSDQRQERATTLVDGFIRDGKLFPYERPGAIEDLVRDIEDDELHPRAVKFKQADGTEVERTREQSRVLQFTARAPHGLTTEKMAAFALANASPDPEAETPESRAARTAELLAQTPAGREVLATMAAVSVKK